MNPWHRLGRQYFHEPRPLHLGIISDNSMRKHAVSDELILAPREAIVAALEAQKEQFFAAGHTVQQIQPGVSGLNAPRVGDAHYQHLQKERAKLAPALRQLAQKGVTINAAALALNIKTVRAQMIARENGIHFGPQQKRDQ